MSKDQILHYLKAHKQDFFIRYGISALGLFGSYSKNRNKEDSDIDIVIQTQIIDYFKLIEFKNELETAFNTKVEIIRYREKMNPYLKKHIEEDAIYV